MKILLVWFLSITTILATEAIVNLIGNKGDCVPEALITRRLSLHGIDNITVSANGSAPAALVYPYDVTFVSLPLNQTNTIVVVSTDFLRRVVTNTFTITSRQQTYNKRK